MAGLRSQDPVRVWRLCLAGAGNVGGAVLATLDQRGPQLRERYGVELVVTGVAQLGGAVVHPGGLDLPSVRAALADGRALSTLDGVGRPGMTPIEMIDDVDPDIVLEATPVDLHDDGPGRPTVRHALRHGRHVVLANKAPLALDYAGTVASTDLAESWTTALSSPRPRLRFSATVAGALPVVNIGRRDLAGTHITRFEAVLNGTSQSILRAMETGADFATALLDTQRRGIAEADPSLDIGGYDAACKLVIVANTVLDHRCTLSDVTVTGIESVDPADIRAARTRGHRIVPLCLAEATDSGYRLAVRPTELPDDHPLAGIHPDEMAVVFHADEVNRLFASSLEPGPDPAAAAMIRDVLDIVAAEHRPRRRWLPLGYPSETQMPGARGQTPTPERIDHAFAERSEETVS